jgi:hypothetical protein
VIISVQALGLYLEQAPLEWSVARFNRAQAHILTAGNEVRGALASLYGIPAYTRTTDGVITSPTSVSDPEGTALGPIVKMLAASFLLNPSRGVQPQEDRNAASEYRAAALKQLQALQDGRAFIAPLDQLALFGITPTAALIALARARSAKAIPLLRQATTGYFGPLTNPEGGGTLEPT